MWSELLETVNRMFGDPPSSCLILHVLEPVPSPELQTQQQAINMETKVARNVLIATSAHTDRQLQCVPISVVDVPGDSC